MLPTVVPEDEVVGANSALRSVAVISQILAPLAGARVAEARGQKALLTCDVWEHAYYLDYRNAAAEVR